MDIKAIRLRNFRGFQDARIELKPLTVLIGSNSAGKSSFGQALAALAHVHKFYVTGPQASLTPPASGDIEAWPVDLGKTNDLRTEGTEGPVKIELETTGGLVELGFGGIPNTEDELLLSYIAHPTGEQSIPQKPSHKTVKIVPKEHTSDVIIEGAFHQSSYVTDSKPAIEIRRINERQWQEDKTEVSVILLGLVVKAVQHMTGTQRVLSGAASDALSSFLENLTYLRANRKRPARGYEDKPQRFQHIGYSGESTPTVLLNKGQTQVKYAEPPAIPNSVDEARTSDRKWEEKQGSLSDALNAWLLRLDIASHVEIVPPSGVSKDLQMRVSPKGQSKHDITEIGFGVSQVIPVLVAGLLQPEDSLFIVDLPEAHLHPRPQSAIADFFCSLALSGRTSLVETHSEMFFHRLRLRAAQDPRLMDNIAVYFIDPPKDGFCSKPRPVGLGFEEELRWPEGFLQEAYETEMQINAIRQARNSHP